MSKNKEIIWVSKELAEEYRQLNSVEEQEKAVKKVIESKRLDLEQEQELLSESLLEFKSVCLAHKKELGKVYKEQADLLYKLWEDMGDISSKVSKHAQDVAAKLRPISNEIETLKKSVASMKLYVPAQLTELAVSVGRMSDSTKSLLRDLLNLEKGGDK